MHDSEGCARKWYLVNISSVKCALEKIEGINWLDIK